MMDNSVAQLKGVGKVRAAAFQKLNIHTVTDLLRFMPRDYQDFSILRSVGEVQQGDMAALRLKIINQPKLVYPKKGMQMVTATLQDETGQIQATWFNQPYRKNQLSLGETHFFCGRIDKSHGTKLINPMLFDYIPGILPVYPLVHGIAQRHIRDAMRQALSIGLEAIPEAFPEAFRENHALIDIHSALQNVHFPATQRELSQARYRLAFEDMLYYLLAIALLKNSRTSRTGIAYRVEGEQSRFQASLPYMLTTAQKRVIGEIASDMQRGLPMNRLVQGDVGSGKTALAFFALHVAQQNGYQGVLMAPTEILAQQHYAQLQRTYGEKAIILRGGMRKQDRERAYNCIENGEAQIVVGTHALLQTGVRFEKLGLVITDEQHRFGVRQRAILTSKGNHHPDVLVMSATPIPRTLAMLLYGDLEFSVLDEMPPGRKPVKTRVVPTHKRMDMYAFIENQAKTGNQCYVVCPFVEQSEEMVDIQSAGEVYAELQSRMPNMRIALLHGRLAKAKKDDAIELFRRGQVDILVSTSVVEVGVDVPNATIMVIESAERFGLAQLHQLRGRVGRGSAQSYCFLLNTGQDENARLQIMTQTNDGFVVAQKDLELRGPGEFLGTKQHGVDEMQSICMAQNMDVLLQAKYAAEAIMHERTNADYAPIFARANDIFYARMQYIANN